MQSIRPTSLLNTACGAAVCFLTGLTPLILIACHTTDSTAIDIKAAAAVVKVGSDPLNVVAGDGFPDSIRVIVSDGASFPKYGVRVAFAVTEGGGSITPAAATTDAKGRAAAKFTTGMTIGANTATATVAGLPVVSFNTTTIAAPPPIPSEFWSNAASGTKQHLNGIWGSSATDVWAVGYNETILHYNGTSWSGGNGTLQSFAGVWGSSASDVWIVGDNGEILHYNGTDWSEVPSGTSDFLTSVWGTSTSDVWAVGNVGTILHYNGTSWSSVPSGTFQLLDGVWGNSASDVWAVGDNGTILHYDGTTWAKVANSATLNLLSSVWGSSASDVWAVGYYQTMVHYNGERWSSVSSGGLGSLDLNSIWGTSSSDVWTARGDGTMAHYNGVTWSTAPTGTTQYLLGVWGTSVSNVWAVGFGGTILHGSPPK